jgi:hypothetical protein
MAFGKKQPALSGGDYLLGISDTCQKQGQPYAAEFRRMVMQCYGTEELLIGEVIAKRPLKEHEASPASIIINAVELAQQRGDTESIEEILRVGMALLAKWPDYLAALFGSGADVYGGLFQAERHRFGTTPGRRVRTARERHKCSAR